MGTRISALLFDFDGIVVDTESAALRAWQEVFEEHGQTLTLDEWAPCLGTLGGFDPLGHLETLVGPLAERDALNERRLRRKLELVARETLRPGIEGYLSRAVELGLDAAIVSSNATEWIESNLARAGCGHEWALVCCSNGDRARAKPAPCLYEEALDHLGISPEEAIAFEDSPNGVAAAKAAGLFCVAVPNDVTRTLDLSAADLRLESFEDATLDEVLAAVYRVAQ